MSEISLPRKRSKLPWVVGGVIAVIILLAVAGQGEKKPKDDDKPAKVGDEVTFKDSTWVVLGAEDLGKSLKSNNPLVKDATTDGQFVRVRFKVRNTTNKEDRILKLPVLINSQGREFRHIDRESFFIPKDAKAMTLEALPAGITKEFYSVFEVPADAAGLRFQARALKASGDKKLVDLGL